VIEGRFFVTTDDIKAVAHPVLRHRVLTNFTADSEGISSDKVIDRLLDALPERGEQDDVAPELAGAFGAA
jgi:MoxR-like ATPase